MDGLLAQPWGCALLLAAPQALQSPGSCIASPLPGDAVGTQRQLHFHGKMSSSPACPAVPRSALQLRVPLARDVVKAMLIKITFLQVPGLSQALLSAGTSSKGWRLPGACARQEGLGFPCVIGCPGDVSRSGWHLTGTVPSMQQPNGCWGKASANYR